MGTHTYPLDLGLILARLMDNIAICLAHAAGEIGGLDCALLVMELNPKYIGFDDEVKGFSGTVIIRISVWILDER